MAMNRIKVGDLVVVIAGKDRTRSGRVLQIKADRVLVEGLNLVKKHKKHNPNQDSPGGIVEQEAFMDISNVAIMNQQTNKADRVGFKVVDGKKVRYLKSNNEVIDVL